MLLRLKTLLILILIVNATKFQAQSISVNPPLSAATCSPNSFSVEITSGTTAIINGILLIDYPDQAVFQNPNGYPISEPAPGQVAITVNLTAGSSQFINYDLYFPCEMISPQQDLSGTYIPYSINSDEWHLLNSGGGTLVSETSISYLVDYPYIIGSYTTDPSLSALTHADQTITRFIEFANEGTIPFDGVMRFTDVLDCGEAVSITNMTLEVVDGTGTPIGTPLLSVTPNMLSSTEYYIDYDFYLNATELPVTTPGTPRSLRITETIDITGCVYLCGGVDINFLTSNFDLEWGCRFGDYTPPFAFPTTPIPALTEAENLCKSIDIYQATIDRDGLQPNVRIYRTLPAETQPFENICMQNPDDIAVATSATLSGMYTQREYKYINQGSAPAYAININLREYVSLMWPQNQDLVFLEEIEILDNSGVDITNVSLVPGSVSESALAYSSPSECVLAAAAAGMTPIRGVSYKIEKIEPGEEATFRFKILRCCPRTENYFNQRKWFDTWALPGFANTAQFGGGGFSNECTQAATVPLWGTTEDPVNGLYKGNHKRAWYLEMVQEDLSPPGDMTGGAGGTCDYNNTREFQILTNIFNASNNDVGMEQIFANTPGGQVNGQLKVNITLDQGLLLNAITTSIPVPDASQVLLKNTTNPLAPFDSIPATYITSSASSYGITLPSGAIGSTVEVIFDLSAFSNYTDLRHFMENSVLCFPLTPCCPSYMDDPAGYQVDWYLNVSPNAAPCTDCWIPMSRIEDEINIHCPGCVTPGMIVYQLDAKRTNFGYIDLNENGLVDAGITTPMTASEIQSLIPINASKTMPGDNIELTAKAYLQDGDDTNGGFDYATYEAAYSTGVLDKLYIDIRIPCGDENVNLWNIVSQQVSLNGGSFLDISAYRIDPIGTQSDGQYFYAIPNSLFGTGYNFQPLDDFEVKINYNICKNDENADEVVDCDITCLMWIAGGTTMPRNAFSTIPTAPDENGSLPGSFSAMDRAGALDPYLIFYCEAFSTEVKHYRFYESISSRWDNRGIGSYWNQIVCRKKLVSTYRIKLGQTNGVPDFFKFEHRPVPTQFVDITFPIPDFYDLETTNFQLYSTIPRHDGSVTYYPRLWDPTASPPFVLPTLTEGSFAYNYSNYQLASEDVSVLNTAVTTNYTTNELFKGDEYWSQLITVFFNPEETCDTAALEVPVSDGSVSLPAYFNLKPSLCDNLTETITEITNGADYLIRPNPNMNLVPPIAQYVESNNHCFSFDLTNYAASLSQVENGYFILEVPTGMSLNSVTLDGAPISPISGVYYAGTFATFGASKDKTVQVCFDLDNCATGQLILPIRYGYGCIGYPTTTAETGCWEDTVEIEINPAPFSLNAASINTTQSTEISPCGTAHFEVCTDPTQNGNIYDLYWSINLPVGAQLASDVVATFNPVGGPTQTQSFLQSTVLSGQTYMVNSAWDLTDINDEFCIAFDYEFVPACSPLIGTPPVIELGGTAYCGDNVAVNPFLNPLVLGPSLCTPIAASATIIDVNCNNDGSIDLTATGDSPLSYNWVGPSGFTSTSEDISGLAGGVYTVTIIDANQCSEDFTFTISENLTSVTVNETACDSYTTPGGTFTSSGTYSYVQTNFSTGCLENVILNLTIIVSPVLVNPGNQTVCDSYTLPVITGTNLSGGEAYYDGPQPGGNLITGPITTTQTVWIYDANGLCSDEVSFVVNVVQQEIVYLSPVVGCDQYVIPSGPGAGTVVTTSGVYTFTTGAPSCYTEIWDITIMYAPTLSIASLTDVSCFGYCDGQVSVTTGTSGFYSYTLMDNLSIVLSSNTVGTFTGLCAGNYSIVVLEDPDIPCPATIYFTINEPADSISLSADITHMCEKLPVGAIDLTVTGGTAPYTYSWTGNGGISSSSEDLTGLYPGQYTVTVIDANGCQLTQTFTVELLELQSFSASPVVWGSCEYTLDNITLPSGALLSTSGVNVVSVSWSVDGVVVGNTPSVTYDFTEPGGYTVCVTVVMEINGITCQDQLCQTIDVACIDCEETVDASFNITNLGNGNFAFSNASSPTFTSSYLELEWAWGDGLQTTYVVNSTNPNYSPSHQYSETGIYEVCLVVTEYFVGGFSCSDTICETVVFCKKPNKPIKICGTANFNALQNLFNTTVYFNSMVSTLPGWTVQSTEWYFGYGSAIGSGASVSHTFPPIVGGSSFVNYNVTVVVTLVNAMGQECKICRTKTVKVKKLKKTPFPQLGMVISPNPSRGDIVLRTDVDYNGPVQITILDARGNSISKFSKDYSPTISLRVDGLHSGLYSVEMLSDDFRIIERMVIMK